MVRSGQAFINLSAPVTKWLINSIISSFELRDLQFSLYKDQQMFGQVCQNEPSKHFQKKSEKEKLWALLIH